jgi:hypothetical protein
MRAALRDTMGNTENWNETRMRMRWKAKAWIAVALRAVLLICCWIGVHKAVLPAGGGFMSSEKLLYFTYQSNVLALILTAVYFGLGVRRLAAGSAKPPRALQIARYAAAVSVTITFLVFWCLLSRWFRLRDLLTVNNQMLHTVVPALFVADFLLFDKGRPMSRSSAPWAAVPPLCYLAFSLSYTAAHPAYYYRTGSRYAYDFLDLDRYGWLGSEAGMGVLWWSLLLLCLTLGVGYLYRFMQRKTAGADLTC